MLTFNFIATDFLNPGVQQTFLSVAVQVVVLVLWLRGVDVPFLIFSSSVFGPEISRVTKHCGINHPCRRVLPQNVES